MYKFYRALEFYIIHIMKTTYAESKAFVSKE